MTILPVENDPYPEFDRQLDEASVVWSDHFHAWIVCGLPEIKQVAGDLRTYSVARGYQGVRGESWKKVEGKGIEQVTRRWLRYQDPPDWNRFRWVHDAAVPYQAVQPEQQPQEIRDQFQELVRNHLKKSQGKTRIEAMQEWCIPLPCLGTMTVLGLDLNDFEKLYEWVVNGTLIAFRFPSNCNFWSDEAAARGNDYADKLVNYLEGVVESRKANRGNDFISRMLNYSDQHPGEFTNGDLIKIIVTHINGGFHESAFQVLGEGIRLLISTGQYQQLVEDPSKATACVDEILRYHAAAPMGARRANADVTLAGKSIKKDDFVFLNFGAAQRDPKIYENARSFNINRSGVANGDLSFGYGPHVCTGRAQVKLLSSTFFAEVAKSYPKLQIETWPANCYMSLRYQPREDVVLLESLPLKLS